MDPCGTPFERDFHSLLALPILILTLCLRFGKVKIIRHSTKKSMVRHLKMKRSSDDLCAHDDNNDNHDNVGNN